ncbi:MAG: SH3 domain-containing protein, partial [Anaerolineae bacterium]
MLNRRSVWLALGASLLMAWLLVACGPSATPTAEPTPTRPLRPTFTPSPAVTDTPTSPPPTPTPADTPTPAATDTPTETPTDTPEPPTPTPEPQPVAVVSGSNQVNVRSGPGTAYPVQGRVARGTELEIVGRNDAGDWWQVCCVDDQEVWIVARLVTVQGDTGSVEVAANIPPAPTRPPAP